MTEVVSNLSSKFKKGIEDKKIIFGSKSVLKALKLGRVDELIYSSNAPKQLIDDLKHYSNNNLEIKIFKGDAKELGIACGRTHSVLVAALLKD